MISRRRPSTLRNLSLLEPTSDLLHTSLVRTAHTTLVVSAQEVYRYPPVIRLTVRVHHRLFAALLS